MGKETSALPALQEANSLLSKEELAILKKQYESEGDYISVQTRFDYAWGLVKSNSVKDQREGIIILTQIFKDSPERRRECLYYISVGSLKLGDYNNARRYANSLLEQEPDNYQVVQLRQAIEDKLNKEGLIGVAIVGGAIAAGAVVLGAILGGRRR